MSCGAEQPHITWSTGSALLTYQLRSNPSATLRFNCTKCRTPSVYTGNILSKLTPNEIKPIPLPEGVKWVLLLLQIQTADSVPYYGFFGELVLAKQIDVEGNRWGALLGSESQFAPSLEKGVTISGEVFNGHFVCTEYLENGKFKRPNLVLPPPGSGDFGLFSLPKTGDTNALQGANIKCVNPSCSHYFGVTYSQIAKAPLTRAGESAHAVLTCEICKVSVVVDKHSFTGLFKV